MSVIRKMAYLEAMGIDGYVSRSQLVGAAPTRRLAIVRPQAAGAAEQENATLAASDKRLSNDSRPASGASALLDELRRSDTKPATAAAQTSQQSQPTTVKPVSTASSPRFSMAVIASGSWLWLETLEDMPLMSEQVWLVESMATALMVASDTRSPDDLANQQKQRKAKVMQFDWPMHNNPQLDGGVEAASASLCGFLERQQSEHQSHGVVLMGSDASHWVASDALSSRVVATPSTREMLSTPLLKQQAWRDLRGLLSL
ncbi:MAG: hypothetical protein AB8C02_03345 [Halioglobus sp.]